MAQSSTKATEPDIHPRKEDLILLAGHRTPPELRATLRTHVEKCSTCQMFLDDEPSTCLTEVPNERRGEHRVPTDQPALVRILQPFYGARFPVQVMDISKSGARVALSFGVPVGALVQIQFKHSILMAEVRHCTRIDDGYHIGLRTESVYNFPRSTSHTNSEEHYLRGDVTEYLRGGLRRETLNLVHAHLDTCGFCQQNLANALEAKYGEGKGSERSVVPNSGDSIAIRSLVPFEVGLKGGQFRYSSPEGIEVQVEQEFGLGTRLHLWINRHVAIGLVRSCEDAPHGYKLTVCIQDVFVV